MSFLDNLKKINQSLSSKGYGPLGIVENESMFRDILREMRSTSMDLGDITEASHLVHFSNFLSRRREGESEQEKQIKKDILREFTQQRIERIVAAAEDHPEQLKKQDLLLLEAQAAVDDAAYRYTDNLPNILGPTLTNELYGLTTFLTGFDHEKFDNSSDVLRKGRLNYMAEMAQTTEIPFEAYKPIVEHYSKAFKDALDDTPNIDMEGLVDLKTLLNSSLQLSPEDGHYLRVFKNKATQLKDALNFDFNDPEKAAELVGLNDDPSLTRFYATLAVLHPKMFMDEFLKGPSSKIFGQLFDIKQTSDADYNVDTFSNKYLSMLIRSNAPPDIDRRTFDPAMRHFMENAVGSATPENREHVHRLITDLGNMHYFGPLTAQFMFDHIEKTGEDLLKGGQFLNSDELEKRYRRVQIGDAVRKFNDSPTPASAKNLAQMFQYRNTRYFIDDVVRDTIPNLTHFLSSSAFDKMSDGELNTWAGAIGMLSEGLGNKLFPTMLKDAIETKNKDLFRGVIHSMTAKYYPEEVIDHPSLDGTSLADMDNADDFLKQMSADLASEHDDDLQSNRKLQLSVLSRKISNAYFNKSGKVVVPSSNRALNVHKDFIDSIGTMAVKPTSSGLRAIRARLKELGGKLSIKDVSAKLNPFRRTEQKESLVDDWSPFLDWDGSLSVEKLQNYKEFISTTPQARSIVPKIDRLIEHLNNPPSTDVSHLIPTGLPPQLKSSPVKKKVVNYNTVLDWDRISRSGNVDAGKLDEAIESVPDAQVGYHTGNFVLGMQQHTADNQKALVLSVTPQQIQQMKKEGLWSDYKILSRYLPTDLHPQNKFGLGWVRWTEAGNRAHPTNPMHIHIDEIQSDWDDMLKKAVGGNDDYAPLDYASKPNWHNGYYNQEQAKEREDRTRSLMENYGRIRKILFHGLEPGELLHEAFHQHIRNSMDVETKPVFWSIWSKDSKKKMQSSSLDVSKPPPKDWFVNYYEKPMTMGATPDKYSGRTTIAINHPSVKDAPFMPTSQTASRFQDEPTFTGKIHKKEQDFDREEIKLGVKTEMEHTTSTKEALKIALDHLKEDPRYYSKAKECGLIKKAEPLSKAEPDDFFDLFQTDNDPAIHNAMRGLSPETGIPHAPTARAWKDTVDYVTHVPEAKSGLIRYLVRNPDNQEHIDLLKQLVKSNGSLLMRKMSDDFSRLTGQSFREYMAKHYLPHVMSDSGSSADEEIFEDILAHHHDTPSVLAAMKGTNAPVHNVSILGTLANTVYKNNPEKMFSDFKIDQQAVRKMPVNGQLGYIVHAMLNHDTAHDAHKVTMLSNVSSIMDELRDKSSSIDSKIGQMVRKHNVHPSNAILNRIASTSPDPSSLGMQLGVKAGSAALRKLRDHIEQLGRDILPNELPSGQRWNTITSPITDRQGNVNYVLDWNPLRERNGKISAASVQKYIDSMPTRYYDTAVVPYESGKQNHSTKPQYVFRLKITDDDMAKLRSTGADRTLQKLTDLGKQSGHPVDDRVIGWIRYTPGEDGNHFIDESQTDLDTNFESSLRQQLKQYYGDNVPEETYRMHLRRVRDMFPEAHIQQIKDLMFGKKASSEVLHEAWQQHMRQTGNVGSVWHGHSSTTKAPIADMDMGATLPGHMKVHYEETPKALGATPANYGTIEAEKAPTYEHLKNARIHGDKVRKFEE
jgi:hypothetical protein